MKKWKETDDEFRARAIAEYPGGGTFDHLKYIIQTEAPVCARYEFSHKKSRKVPIGSLKIVFVEHDPRPWWKFW